MAYTTIDKPTDYFNTVLYTGTGSDDTAITGVGFSPDWVWLKKRSATGGHFIQDRVRGATKSIYSDGNYAEDTVTTAHKSFDSDGFTLGTNSNVNVSSGTHVSWNWLADNTSGSSNTDGNTTSTVSANTTAGFSIVSYTGNGSNTSVGHGLGVAPDCMIVKCRSSNGTGWWVYHKSLGATKAIYLHDTAASFTNDWLQDTAPTNSVFTLDNNGDTNGSSKTMIAYCFKEKQGYSKFNSYTGNGSSDGSFIYLGFKPAWFMLKSISGEAWNIYDNKRLGYNDRNDQIKANTTGAEVNTSAWRIDILSNGVKIRGSDSAVNSSGTTYIYMAFAENPFVTSSGIPTTAR